ncbi:MAG: ATPase, T2SS/T4P/T4SS family [Lautropia sp.]|nr:ATPase, T2SS/T4P/T4SS family [Lautropia sp.]
MQMLDVVIEEEGRETRTVRVDQFPARIGRDKDAEVRLGGWRIARVHAELQRIGRGVKLVDLGTIIGTRVNGERIVEYGPLSESDEILLGGYRLRVQGQGLRLEADDGKLLSGETVRREDVFERGVLAPDERALHHQFDTVAAPAAAQGNTHVDRDRFFPVSVSSSSLASSAGVLQSARSLSPSPVSGHADDASVTTRGSTGRGSNGASSRLHADRRQAAEHDGAAAQADEQGCTRPDDGGDTCDGLDGLVCAQAADTPTSPQQGAAETRPATMRKAYAGADADMLAGARGGHAAQRALAADVMFAGADTAYDVMSTADAESTRLQAYAQMAQEQSRALGWRRQIHRQLLEVIDLRRSNLAQFSIEELRAEVRGAVERIVAGIQGLPADIDREALVRDTVDEAVGLGPLERLMTDPLISEIMVNSATDIFVERQGRLQQVPLAFSDDDAIRNVIERIVAPLGRRIDESSPLVDARLADGSRVNAIIPPVALKGPTITIRRFNRKVMTPDTLVENRSASPAMMAFLKIAVEQRKSMIVSGGTGSGKTTLLNVLSNLIPLGERLITIEDAAELKLMHPHLVSLESRPPNAEGRGAITIRDLVKNSLRMRPDRIIVGECRGGEALDMMQAMNTGHEGSMTTVHANAPRDVLARLEMLMLMAGIELPLTALREQVASAVHLIVHQARFSDGSRRITSITEVCGVESGKIQTHEIFRFEQTGIRQGKVIGRFRACNEVPVFYDELRERGIPVDLGIFEDRDNGETS